MAIKFSELLNKRRTVKIALTDGDLSVTYNPSAFCAKNRENLKEDGSFTEWVRWFLVEAIIEWDMVGDDGEPLAIADTISTLPDVYVETLFTELRGDASYDPKRDSTISDTLKLAGVVQTESDQNSQNTIST